MHNYMNWLLGNAVVGVLSYNCYIKLIILAQESCLNSTVLLRYDQKSKVNFYPSRIYCFYHRKWAEFFLPYLDN